MEKETLNKYDIRYDKTYFRGTKESIKKRVKRLNSLGILIGITGILEVSIFPFFASDHIAIGLIIWGVFIFLAIVLAFRSDKMAYVDERLDFKYVVGLILTDKETKEEHPGFVLADGLAYLNKGVQETIYANTRDGIKLPYVSRIEKNMVEKLVKQKMEENAREFRRMVEYEDFQDNIVKAILANNYEYKEINLYFFDRYRRGQKHFTGRFYTIPEPGGMERTVLIPNDCEFESRVD